MTLMVIGEGTSGAELRNIILSDPFLNGLFGWMVDGLGSGINLAAIRAINSATRAEIRDDKKQCWANGHYVNNVGKCITDPEQGLQVAFRNIAELQDDNNVRKSRIEAYIAASFFRDWNNAIESGENENLGKVIEQYGNSGFMETNSYINAFSFSSTNPQQILDETLIGDGDIAASVRLCSDTVTTNCVNPFDIQDIWDDFGRHVQVIFKGLEIPGLPEWLPFPGILKIPTLGDIWDTVTGTFDEEVNRQLEECADRDDNNDGVKNTPAECEAQLDAAGILTGVITQGATDIATATGDKVREIIDSTLEGIDCALNPAECAGKIKDAVGDIFDNGDVWGSADPTADGIPDWLRVIILGGQYGEEIIGALEGIIDQDLDNNGTVGLPITDGCEEGEADFGNGCEPRCPENPNIPASSEQCVSQSPDNGYCDDGVTEKDNPEGTNCPEYEPPLSAEEQRCNEQGRIYDELNDVCTEDCANPEHVVGSDGVCGPPEITSCPDGTMPEDHQDNDCSKPLKSEDPEAGDDDPYCVQGRPADGTFGAQNWDINCSDQYCTDGTRKTDSEGTNCPGYVAPCENNATLESDCTTCANGRPASDHENGDCSQPLIQVEPTPCANGATLESDCSECPDGSTPSQHEFGSCDEPLIDTGDGTDGTPTIEEICSEPRPEGMGFDAQTWDRYCSGGSVDTSACDQQNRVTREDGTCGECKPGYSLDPEGFDQCVRDPETPVTSPDNGSSSGGGGGGGSMLTGQPLDLGFDIAGDPELLARTEFPITNYLAGLFTNSNGGRNA